MLSAIYKTLHQSCILFIKGRLSFTCCCFSSVTSGFWSDGQFDTQSLALIVAGVIHGGVHHVIDGVHETGHVLQ